MRYTIVTISQTVTYNKLQLRQINEILQRFNLFENFISFYHKRGPLLLIFNIRVYFPIDPFSQLTLCQFSNLIFKYRGADKSLVRPGRKQPTATEDFDVRISYL